MTADPPPPIALPRPNLGPEPWPSASRGLGFWITTVVGILAAFALMVVWWRKHRRHATLSANANSLPTEPRRDSEATRWIERAEKIRDALASRHGESLQARTTEEIERELIAAATLAPEYRDKIVSWLRSGDRAKFADPTQWAVDSEPVDQGDFDAVLAAIAAAGASSIKSGR